MKFLLSLLISIAAWLPIVNEVYAQPKLELTGNVFGDYGFQNTPDDLRLPSDLNYDRAFGIGGGLDVRYFTGARNGVFGRADATGTFPDEGFSLYTGTVGYGRRFQLGDPTRRTKKNLDLLAGLRGGYARATDEFMGGCWFCGTDAQTRVDAIDRLSGGVLGPVAGLDFGFDIKRFTIGFGTSYSPLFGFGESQSTVHHSLQARLKIGFNLDL